MGQRMWRRHGVQRTHSQPPVKPPVKHAGLARVQSQAAHRHQAGVRIRPASKRRPCGSKPAVRAAVPSAPSPPHGPRATASGPSRPRRGPPWTPPPPGHAAAGPTSRDAASATPPAARPQSPHRSGPGPPERSAWSSWPMGDGGGGGNATCAVPRHPWRSTGPVRESRARRRRWLVVGPGRRPRCIRGRPWRPTDKWLSTECLEDKGLPDE